MTTNQAADRAAEMTLAAFDGLTSEFLTITRRAAKRFQAKDWPGGRADAVERLDAYDRLLDEVGVNLDNDLGETSREQSVWVAAKRRFASLVAHRFDIDRAETFFNSVTRKMLKTVGINREVEFFYLHSKSAAAHEKNTVYRSYAGLTDTESVVKGILNDLSFSVAYEDIDRDAGLVAREIDLCLWPVIGLEKTYSIDVVSAVFFRNKGAYAVGRILADGQRIPLVIPLLNGESGIYVDTVLLHESEASVVFSFAYSYFFVDVERYDALIGFLRSIIPHAQMEELYTSLGYNRHGKTEFYRELHRFVHVSRERFVITPGLEGAVMIVFTLPHYEFVFKVIKDRPCFLRSSLDTPKVITREQVRQRYDFVSHRDRAGRMVDTQEFENLRFRKKRFSSELLSEFVRAAKNTVTMTDEYVVIHHVYVQRKVIPLPVYFQCEKDPEAIRNVLIDFGYFLKDIAASGVFPADLFNTWNYGVTHWGRVVLYDYDDVLPIEQISFREKPLPRNDIEETEPEEDWIVATDEDFFMDEIDRYSGIPRPLRGVFKSIHGDLYTLEFWDRLTGRLRGGEIFDVIPYDRKRRFHDRARLV